MKEKILSFCNTFFNIELQSLDLEEWINAWVSAIGIFIGFIGFLHLLGFFVKF